MTRTIHKQLVTAQDIKHGVGKVSQQRGQTLVELDSVDIPLGLATFEELAAIDPAIYPRVRITSKEYQANSTGYQAAYDVKPLLYIADVELTELNPYVYYEGGVYERTALPYTLTGNPVGDGLTSLLGWNIYIAPGADVIVTGSADFKRDYGARGDAVYQYEVDGSVTVLSGTDDTAAMLTAMADVAAGVISALYVPTGKYWIDSSQIDTPSKTAIVAAGVDSVEFVMSTTNPNLNLFVCFYMGARVRDVWFSGFKVIGSKKNDNTVGGTGIFTFGATNVGLFNLASEGCKGLAWLGNDNVVGGKLYGTQNVYAKNLRVNDCTLFSVYVRGNENPAVGALPEDDTSNINIDGLIIRGSNVGLAIAEGLPFNIKITNYDCQDTDNLLQIESCYDVFINNSRWLKGTRVWSEAAPTPFYRQWQIAGSHNVYIDNCYIDSELQAFAFPLNVDKNCTNIVLSNIKTGDVTRFTTLAVQDGVDTNKNMFTGWKFINCNFPRNSSTFYQTPAIVGGGAPRPLAYWRDWSFSACTWDNDSTTNPIDMVESVGSLVFDEKSVFNGKPPRALKGQKITFNANVRANGIPGSSIQFTAVKDIDPLDQTVLRIGGNFQIEGEVKDVDFDIVHDNGTYDVRNQSAQCRTSNAGQLLDHGATFYRFTGTKGLISDGVGSYKALTVSQIPTLAGQASSVLTYTGTGASLNVTTGLNSVAKNSLVFIKAVSVAGDWYWFDSLRGTTKFVNSNNTGAEVTGAQTLTAFTTTGFTLGTDAGVNTSARTYVATQILETPKVLDIVTDVGTGVAKTIPHNLGTDVGCIITKDRSGINGWAIYYHTLDIAGGAWLAFTAAGVATNTVVWNGTPATSTEFSVGTGGIVNSSGVDYVHYVFAKDICKSYVGNGTTNNVINFGYKPKLVIIKRATTGTVGNWNVYDRARNTTGALDKKLVFDTNAGEVTIASAVTLTDTGIIIGTTNADLNAAGSSYILIAIPEV